ncbi:hypothetical protein [Streptomyces europaeiscabiei]|uniref:hypothetical protein n=1 Tax=Streptomyces europaeiscabiei TaxID=146819 RepID=UPI0029A1F269|nr:hypothetical protein [Streptomyces europaeiscabiei]MDX2765451.1 hypothetical protein [Streptomyces europaeiscabiei]
MTTTATHPKAETGRRVEYAYHRSLIDDQATLYAPGIITGTEPGYNGALLAKVRLDGQRSTLHVPVDYDGLRYLDQVTPVPDLPMGPFTPVADDANGFYERAGVLVAAIGEDGEALIILTGDRDKAFAAATAYGEQIGYDPDYVALKDLQPCWAVFEWQPEDSDSPWLVRWDAAESDDQAVRVHYLAAA